MEPIFRELLKPPPHVQRTRAPYCVWCPEILKDSNCKKPERMVKGKEELEEIAVLNKISSSLTSIAPRA